MYVVKGWYFGDEYPETIGQFLTKSIALHVARQTLHLPGEDWYATAVYQRVNGKLRKVWDSDDELF